MRLHDPRPLLARKGSRGPAAVAGLLLAAASCGESPVAAGERSDTRVRLAFDVSSLNLQQDAQWTGDRVVLSVRSGGTLVERLEQGLPQVLAVHLDGSDVIEAAFDLTLAEGRHTFTAEVLANNGAVLYAGETATDIGPGGFTVQLGVEPLGGVPILYPLTARVPTTAGALLPATVILLNPGVQAVTWAADSLVWVSSGGEPMNRTVWRAGDDLPTCPDQLLCVDLPRLRGSIGPGLGDFNPPVVGDYAEAYVLASESGRGVEVFRLHIGTPAGTLSVAVEADL